MNRTESVAIVAQMDKSSYIELKDHVNTILRLSNSHYQDIDMNEGDIFNVKYNFTIEYLGQCEKVFQSYIEIFKNPKVIRKIDVQEFNHGECLIKSLLDRINELKKVMV